MICFDKVGKSFRKSRVLDGVSLTLNKGERVALVGSNGAGKTTLIRCLLGEYTHDGSVTVAGLSPRQDRAAVLRHIGFVPQIPPPLKMPVSELLGFSATVSGSKVADMVTVIGALGLDYAAIKGLPFVKLSGGMKQKVLIGVALGRPTDILIMDEPAANLDPDARACFFGLLAERAKQNVMLITSHRLDEVAGLVNRVIEMDMGRVVLDDRLPEVASMTDRLSCRVRMRRFDDAFARSLKGWGFIDDGAGWSGQVGGPDRLRFLCMISRYAGILSDFTMNDGGKG